MGCWRCVSVTPHPPRRDDAASATSPRRSGARCCLLPPLKRHAPNSHTALRCPHLAPLLRGEVAADWRLRQSAAGEGSSPPTRIVSESPRPPCPSSAPPARP